jgi:hypothetical protein
MNNIASLRLQKPSRRTADSLALLHGSEVGGGKLEGAFTRFVQSGDFEGNCCSTTSTSVDGSQIGLATRADIAQLGVFGLFENALNGFFGGQLMTVDEVKMLASSSQKGSPEINVVGFQSTDGREVHESVVEFSRDGRNLFGDGNTKLFEQVTTGIGTELNEEVLALFFRGDQPTRVVVETFFNHQDGGAMSAAYKATVEQKLHELAQALGLPDNEIISN